MSFDNPFEGDPDAVRGRRYKENIDSMPLVTTYGDHKTGPEGSNLKTLSVSGGVKEQVYDENHRAFMYMRRRQKEGKPSSLRSMDLGGDFHHRYLKMTEMPLYLDLYKPPPWSGRTPAVFKGFLWPTNASIQFANSFNSKPISILQGASRSEMWGWGSEGIARALPNVPPMNLATFVGELVRDVPKSPGRSFSEASSTLSGLADEFLNYQFGISPTLSEARAGLGAAFNADSILREAEKLENKFYRRRIRLVDEDTTTVEVPNFSQFMPLCKDLISASVPHRSYTKRVRRRVWVSTCFTRQGPPRREISQLQKAQAVFGRPDATTAWNLTPWSFMADWFLSTGSVMKNISYLGRDGVRLRWAYVMAEDRTTHTFWAANAKHESSVQFEELVQHRYRAHPLGFGLRPNQLEDKQKAILTALGLSRWA